MPAPARAILTNTSPEGVTSYLDADVVVFTGILGHLADHDEARSGPEQIGSYGAVARKP